MPTQFVTAWIPIRTAFHLQPLTTYSNNREDFLNWLPDALERWDPNISSVTAMLASPSQEIIDVLAAKDFIAGTRYCDYFRVEANVSIQDAEPDDLAIKAYASMDLTRALERMFVLSELAYPGTVNTLEGLVIAEGKAIYRIDSKSTHVSLLDPTPAWPPLE